MTIRETSGSHLSHSKSPNTNMLLCFSNILLGRICTAREKKKKELTVSHQTYLVIDSSIQQTGRTTKKLWLKQSYGKCVPHGMLPSLRQRGPPPRAPLAPWQWPPSNATDKKARHTQRPIPPLLHLGSRLPLPTLLLGNIPDSSVPYIQRSQGVSVHIGFSVRQAINSR